LLQPIEGWIGRNDEENAVADDSEDRTDWSARGAPEALRKVLAAATVLRAGMREFKGDVQIELEGLGLVKSLVRVMQLDESALFQTGHPDPMHGLSATELGHELGGLGDEMVRIRERAGEFFSKLPEGRKRGRLYPAFQGWPGVVGTPLIRVLVQLQSRSDSFRWYFFALPRPRLGGLTPVEVLTGRLLEERAVDADAVQLLAARANARLAAVVEEARSAGQVGGD